MADVGTWAASAFRIQLSLIQCATYVSMLICERRRRAWALCCVFRPTLNLVREILGRAKQGGEGCLSMPQIGCADV